MKRYIQSTFALLGLLVIIGTPLFMRAESAANNSSSSATSAGTTTSPLFCIRFKRSLSYGSRGDDVTALQQVLGIDPTGFFGPTTLRLLTNFQIQNGIITASSTGGMVGPVTRTFFSRRCDTTSATSTPPIGGNKDANPANNPMCKSWFDGCNTCSRQTPGGVATCTLMACMTNNTNASIWANSGAAYCKEYYTTGGSSSLSINSFSGPSQLIVGQAGTWTINVTDTSNGTLTYTINWGDTFLNAADLIQAMASDTALTQASSTMSLQHTYSKSGVYSITMEVKSSSGLSTKAMATVYVVGVSNAPTTTPTICTMEYNPVCGSLPGNNSNNQTYSNTCMMNAAGASLVSQGACTSTSGGGTTICPMYALVCPTGQHDVISNNCSHSCVADTTNADGSNSTGGSCVYGGTTYKTGYARPEGMDCSDLTGCWNSARLYVCRSGSWQKEMCSFGNITGAFPNSSPVPTGYNNATRSYSCSGTPTTSGGASVDGAANTTSSGSACTLNNTSYPNGQSISPLTWCQQTYLSTGQGCALGLIIPSALVCTNGQWVPKP